MRLATAFMLFFVCCVNALAADSDRPVGTNCNLAKPPPDAGEESDHGLTVRIYPRAKDIGSAYNGCQIIWAPDGAGWITVSAVAVENGDPVRIWSSVAGNSALLACRYKKGKLVSGDEANCPVPTILIAKSLAAGCVAKMRDATGALRPGPRPSGCDYE